LVAAFFAENVLYRPGDSETIWRNDWSQGLLWQR
jgi:hypothetical protein